jgi:hypothetical protein
MTRSHFAPALVSIVALAAAAPACVETSEDLSLAGADSPSVGSARLALDAGEALVDDFSVGPLFVRLTPPSTDTGLPPGTPSVWGTRSMRVSANAVPTGAWAAAFIGGPARPILTFSAPEAVSNAAVELAYVAPPGQPLDLSNRGAMQNMAITFEYNAGINVHACVTVQSLHGNASSCQIVSPGSTPPSAPALLPFSIAGIDAHHVIGVVVQLSAEEAGATSFAISRLAITPQ